MNYEVIMFVVAFVCSGALLAALTRLAAQFDLLLPGPEQGTSFVPLLLPQAVADLPISLQRIVQRRWPPVPASSMVQAGTRFCFSSAVPPGFVERLLARCAAVERCRVVCCWRAGMLASGSNPEQRVLICCALLHRTAS